LILYGEKHDFLKIISNRDSVFFFILSLSFFIITFGRGAAYMNPLDIEANQIFIRCLFYTIIPFVIFTAQTITVPKKYLLYVFLLGIFMYSASVILYSYFLDSNRYGYRHLFNPFIGKYVSSTNYSNNIALTFCAGIAVFCFNRNRILKSVSALVVLFSFLGVFITLGRTYWVVVITFLILFPFFSKLSYKKLAISLISIVSLFLLSYLIYHFALPDNLVLKYDRYMLNRLQSLLHADNIRYRLWTEGIAAIFKYPMGGYVPVSVNHYWFHNIWLDTARVAGVIPLILFVIINFYTFFLWYYVRNDSEKNVFILLSIVTLMIMGQDLVIENRDRIITLYFYLMIHFYLFSEKGPQMTYKKT
jgi:hypothetical protein